MNDKKDTPSLNSWIIINKDGSTETGGTGMINGVDFNQVCQMEGNIYEEMENILEDIKIPKDAIGASFLMSDFVHEEGQMTFPETGQWDFPPHWTMEGILLGWDIGFNDEVKFVKYEPELTKGDV